jgi:hypothetical protein
MLPPVRPLARSLLFCLTATAFAGPASAWRIAAILEQEGIGPSGPSEVEGSGFAPGDKIVSVAHSEGYLDNSEIGGTSSVHLEEGTMRGNAHAVAKDSPNSMHQIRFISILEENIEIDYPPALPIAERIVRLRAGVGAGYAATNSASANGFFSVTVNGRRGGVNFGTSDSDPWVPFLEQGWTGNPTAGGAQLEYTAPAGKTDLELDVQLDGTAVAYGIFEVGTGLADVNALNTASFELVLPAGATFTSGSGVFLTEPVPEPGQGALLLAGACILAAWGSRERGSAA